MNNPLGVKIDKHDRVLVADVGNKRICVLNKAGQLLGHIHCTGICRGLTVNVSSNVLACLRHHQIVTFEYKMHDNF